jgi:hypothetical protein
VKLKFYKLSPAIIVVVVVALGVYYLISSHAATPYASNEAESGSLTGSASLVSDSAASNSQAVQFGSTTTTSDGCSNDGSAAPCVGSTTTGAGGWGSPVFDDEFNGTSLNTNNWSTDNGWTTNNVTVSSSNIRVSGGDLILTLASSTSGAEVDSSKADGTGIGYVLPVGGFAEARIDFPGNGTTIYNWPAW